MKTRRRAYSISEIRKLLAARASRANAYAEQRERERRLEQRATPRMTLATATEFCKLKRIVDVPLSVSRESQLTLVLLWRLAKKQAAELGCRFPRGWKVTCSLESRPPWEPKTVFFSRALLGQTGIGVFRFMLAQIAIAVAKETGGRPSVIGEQIGVLLHDHALRD